MSFSKRSQPTWRSRSPPGGQFPGPPGVGGVLKFASVTQGAQDSFPSRTATGQVCPALADDRHTERPRNSTSSIGAHGRSEYRSHDELFSANQYTSPSPPVIGHWSVTCCLVHQVAMISVRTATAAARSACVIETSTGSSTRTGLVRDPRPPRSPVPIHRSTTMPAAATRRTSVDQPADRGLQPLPHLTTTRSTTAISVTTDLRMHLRDRKFRPLDHGLRVRMLTDIP